MPKIQQNAFSCIMWIGKGSFCYETAMSKASWQRDSTVQWMMSVQAVECPLTWLLPLHQSLAGKPASWKTPHSPLSMH